MQRTLVGHAVTRSGRLATASGVKPSFSPCRFKSTTASSSTTPPAFIFDIDGVLKIGKKVLPQGKEVLRILSGDNKLNKKFPFILCTNGGGVTEEERIQKLSSELGVPISLPQLIQAHTPFREYAEKYGDKPVLVVGGRDNKCREVAESYGFKQAYTPWDVLNWDESIWPFRSVGEQQKDFVKSAEFSKIPFAAIFVFHDSRDWGFDIQIMTDVLLSSSRSLRSSWHDIDALASNPSHPFEQLPIFWSNPDLLWGNDYPEPRYGQGAFQEAFKAVWKRTTGRELTNSLTGGKPTKLTYSFAERLLIDQCNEKGILAEGADKVEKLGQTFMLGDNPFSDIQGANEYGFNSILVRTGVFRGKDNHHIHPATSVQPDVLAGVKWALERELGQKIA